ncbi:MAG: hypothetical protein M1380_05245, partial [Chloroflexi bacterium]|nr:hypothetical protein [Chloroflexota bacterium]
SRSGAQTVQSSAIFLTTRHQQGTNSFPHRLKPSHIAQSRARQFGNSRIREHLVPAPSIIPAKAVGFGAPFPT